MLKKWNQFNESKAEKPGENVPGSVKVVLSEEDINLFSDEPSLAKLIADDKVSLLGNDAWYWEDDNQTKAVLDQYLEVAGKNELESVVESLNEDGSLTIEVKVPKIFVEAGEQEGLSEQELVEYIKDSIEMGMLDEFSIEEFKAAIKDSDH